MKWKARQTLFLVIILQIALIAVGFVHHFTHPLDSLFHNWFDGYKNYVTLYSYVTLPSSEVFAFGQYYGMNYPYGDLVIFTDNTPALSMPLKWIHHNILPLDEWVFPIFNYLMLAGLLWSSILVYKILKPYVKTTYLVVIASLALPWIAPQLIRLSNGHFNLSLSCLLLWHIYLLVKLTKKYKEGQPYWSTFTWLVIAGVVSSLFHVYYLGINALIVGITLVGYSLFERSEGFDIRPIMGAVTIPGLTAVGFIGFCSLLGQNILGKNTNATGFDIPDWTMKIPSLFTAYPHFGIDFIVQSSKLHHYESNSYLGSFALFTLVAWLIGRKKMGLPLIPSSGFWKAFGLAGLIAAITALGVKVRFPIFDLTIENFANPLYWARKWTSAVEHFRCLARFNWPFFWAVNFILILFIDRVWHRRPKVKYWRGLMIVLTVFMLLDAKDAVVFNSKEVYKNVLVSSDLDTIKTLIKEVEPEDYEAIVPLPFFHVGSGDWISTIPADGWFSRRSTQLATQLNLPLMASLMSRTDVEQARKQTRIFSQPDSSSIPDLLTDKPLLLFADIDLLEEKHQAYCVEPNIKMTDFTDEQIYFLDRVRPKEIARYGSYRLYSWDPR